MTSAGRHVPLATIIGITVSTVWAVVFLADILMTQYEAAPEVNLVMLVVVGGTFGASVVKRGGNSD